jgi:hypothetical protein
MMLFNFLSMPKKKKKKQRNAYRRRKRALLFAWLVEQELNEEFRHQLILEGRNRRQRGLPRIALLPPFASAWMQLFTLCNDPALITVTGFDHAAFAGLLNFFEGWFKRHTPWTGNKDGRTYCELSPYTDGRKRIINASTCLGLVLAWYRFQGAEYILQGWFGLTAGHAIVWLRFGGRGLAEVLADEPVARVEMPSHDIVKALMPRVQERDIVCCLMYSL